MHQTIPLEIFEKIQQLIPSVSDQVKPLFYRDFMFNMHDLIHGSKLGISLVCLRDAYFRLDTSKISLHSAYVQNIYYEKYHDDESSELAAIRFAKHHLDFIPLNLYAFQEDIAEFLIKYNELDDEFGKWKKDPKTELLFEKKRVVSNAAKVGLFLKEKHATSPFTAIISKLVMSNHWKKTIKYRNSWVHEKPPIIEGLGIQHNRESRIKAEDKRRSFGFGGESKPDYTVQELFEICTKAIELGIKVVNEIISIVDADEPKIKEKIKFN